MFFKWCVIKSAFFYGVRDQYSVRKSRVVVCILHLHKLLVLEIQKLFKMAPHTGSATPEQIDTLLDFLDTHKDLARGRLRSVEGKVQAKRLWEEICNTLNSMGGCTKNVQQWQKVWFDRKHLAKKAAAESRRSASATGGGPSTAHQLSAWELKVLSIMGDGFGDRQTGARVPAFPENLEPLPSTSPPRYLDDLTSESIPQPTMEFAEPSQESSLPIQLPESASHPVSQESSTSRRSSQVTRRRRSQSAAGSVRSRLFRLEEERLEREATRNTELAGIRATLQELVGIRATLQELCGLIREYLSR